ncbi:hypothetical protein RCL1_001311 [Eukaryota sp. TZLM3-RCL]
MSNNTIVTLQHTIKQCSDLLQHQRVTSFPALSYLKDILNVLSLHLDLVSGSSSVATDCLALLAQLLQELSVLLTRITHAFFFRKSRFSTSFSFLSSRLLTVTSHIVSIVSTLNHDTNAQAITQINTQSLAEINKKLDRVSFILGLDDCNFPIPSDHEAALFLAHQYYYGRGLPRNLLRAFNIYSALSSVIPLAKVYTALMLIQGEGVKKNPIQALELLEKAASEKCRESFVALGDLCRDGFIVNSTDLTNEQLEKIPNRGSAEICLVEKDYKKAREYYELALLPEQISRLSLVSQLVPDPDTTVIVSLAHIVYQNYPNETRLAYDLFQKAADLGNYSALNTIAVFYYSGLSSSSFSLNQNVSLSLRLLHQAASLGCVSSYYNLAVAMEQGIETGVIDLCGALNCYKKAAELGLIEAYTGIGRVLFLQKRFNLAKSELRRAADYNCHEAMFLLGEMYRRGLGTITDFLIAFELFSQSSSLGYAPAMTAKADLLYGGLSPLKSSSSFSSSLSSSESVRDIAAAALAYGQASLLGDRNAMFKLALILEEEELLERDLKSIARKLSFINEMCASEYWYIQASLKNHGGAMLNLAKMWLNKGSSYIPFEERNELHQLLIKTRELLLRAFALEVEGAESLLRKVELDLRRRFDEQVEYTPIHVAKQLFNNNNLNSITSVLPATTNIQPSKSLEIPSASLIPVASSSDEFLELEANSPESGELKRVSI